MCPAGPLRPGWHRLAFPGRHATEVGQNALVLGVTWRVNELGIAAHENPRTTMLYDRSGDEISLDEIERVHF